MDGDGEAGGLGAIAPSPSPISGVTNGESSLDKSVAAGSEYGNDGVGGVRLDSSEEGNAVCGGVGGDNWLDSGKFGLIWRCREGAFAAEDCGGAEAGVLDANSAISGWKNGRSLNAVWVSAMGCCKSATKIDGFSTVKGFAPRGRINCNRGMCCPSP